MSISSAVEGRGWTVVYLKTWRSVGQSPSESQAFLGGETLYGLRAELPNSHSVSGQSDQRFSIGNENPRLGEIYIKQ